MKSMEHSVPREWANAENRADDFEILGLCSELSHKVICVFVGAFCSVLFIFGSLCTSILVVSLTADVFFAAKLFTSRS